MCLAVPYAQVSVCQPVHRWTIGPLKAAEVVSAVKLIGVRLVFCPVCQIALLRVLVVAKQNVMQYAVILLL